MKTKTLELPTNWEKGFTGNIALPKGEEPFLFNKKWYIYVWDKEVNDNAVYSYSEDVYIPYGEFQDAMNAALNNNK